MKLNSCQIKVFCIVSYCVIEGRHEFKMIKHRVFKWIFSNYFSIPLLNIQTHIQTLRLRQNGCHFGDGSIRCIFLIEIVQIFMEISFNKFSRVQFYNKPALAEIMVWRHKHQAIIWTNGCLIHWCICVPHPQLVNKLRLGRKHGQNVADSIFQLLIITKCFCFD